MKEAKKGNKNWLGKTHSEETKVKLSEANKGKPRRFGAGRPSQLERGAYSKIGANTSKNMGFSLPLTECVPTRRLSGSRQVSDRESTSVFVKGGLLEFDLDYTVPVTIRVLAFTRHYREDDKFIFKDPDIGAAHENVTVLRGGVAVVDISKNETRSYFSICEAARALSCAPSAIRHSFKNPHVKPYKDRFIFKKF
jgi:hypothetical protein